MQVVIGPCIIIAGYCNSDHNCDSYLLSLPTAGPNRNLFPLVLVVYKFEGAAEHDVSVRPHGSAKSNKPYCRTMKSVQKQLTREAAVQSPKEAIRAVFTAKGGLKGAQSQGSLPFPAFESKASVSHNGEFVRCVDGGTADLM